MIKDTAGVILGVLIILISLLFCGSVLLLFVDNLQDPELPETISRIITVGDTSFNLLLIVPVLLVIGMLIITTISVMKIRKRKRRR